MYDINIKNVKKGRAFNWIFIGFGLLFLVIMFIIFFGSILNRNTLDSETTSTDVNPNRHQDSDGDYVYSPIFTYEVDGQTYTCTSGVSSSTGPGEAPHVIHYDSKNPSNCMSDYAEKIDWFILLFALIPTVFIVIGACMNHSISKRIKQIEALNQTGKLVKNLPFHLEESNISVNDRPLMKIVVNYRLSNGETVTLSGDPRYDRKESDEDGKVDLVIDENNPKNYFLDFDINRISGNRSDDYYTGPDLEPAPNTEPATDPEDNQAPTIEPTENSSEPTVPPAIKI